MTTNSAREQERRYRRWMWERRIRKAAPWLFWGVVAAGLLWLAKR